jgi:hypothetical protein
MSLISRRQRQAAQVQHVAALAGLTLDESGQAVAQEDDTAESTSPAASSGKGKGKK